MSACAGAGGYARARARTRSTRTGSRRVRVRACDCVREAARAGARVRLPGWLRACAVLNESLAGFDAWFRRVCARMRRPRRSRTRQNNT